MLPPLKGDAVRGLNRWNTLRARFALWTAGLLLAALVGFGALVYGVMSRSLYAAVDDTLRLNATQALAVIETENGRLDLPDSFVQPGGPAELRTSDFVVRLLGPEGAVLREFGPYRGAPLPAAGFRAARQGSSGFDTVFDPASGETVRLFTAPVLAGNQVVGIYQVGQTLAGVTATLSRLRLVLLFSIPLVVILAGLGGYTLAARALAPVDEMTRTAQRISAQDLSARLHVPAADDEIGRLAATFNEMLARLEAAFRRERQFTADASHELRTPLATIQTILQVTRERPRDAAWYERALADLAVEANRLQQLAESLLLLARGGERGAPAFERVDLSRLLEDTAESMRPLAEAKDLSLSTAVPGGLAVRGDADGLIRLFANLLDNAIKYTPQGQVSLSAARLPDRVIGVTVADTGLGIAPEHVDRIFERFYRAEESRTSDGVGLGLSIVRDIAAVHGGSVAVISTVGAGSTFTVHLPEALER